MDRKALLPAVFCFFALTGLLSAQTTAGEFFDKLSDNYGEIRDYQAEIKIVQGTLEQEGTLFYKSPNLLRINYTEPKDQVLCVDNEKLQLYIPEHSVVMVQPLKSHTDEALENMATRQGLRLLKNNYSIGYVSGPDPVPLDDEHPNEMVVKLKLFWRNTDEGFRQLEISVNNQMLIRRIKGVAVNYEEIQFDYTNIVTNQDIPDARFNYEPPASANAFENFLFTPDES